MCRHQQKYCPQTGPSVCLSHIEHTVGKGCCDLELFLIYHCFQYITTYYLIVFFNFTFSFPSTQCSCLCSPLLPYRDTFLHCNSGVVRGYLRLYDWEIVFSPHNTVETLSYNPEGVPSRQLVSHLTCCLYHCFSLCHSFLLRQDLCHQ